MNSGNARCGGGAGKYAGAQQGVNDPPLLRASAEIGEMVSAKPSDTRRRTLDDLPIGHAPHAFRSVTHEHERCLGGAFGPWVYDLVYLKEFERLRLSADIQ